jgi:O-antigen/teichoic acid export membrane protein
VIGVLFVLLGQARTGNLVFASTCFILLFGTNNMLDSLQTAARRRGVVALHQGASQWLRFLFAVALIGVFGGTSAVGMWGYALSALVVLLSQLYFFARRALDGQSLMNLIYRAVPGEWYPRIFAYAAPLMSWGIFTWAQMTSDRWALKTFTSSQEVGYYSALYQLGYYPLVLLSSVITQFIQPLLFKDIGDGSDPLRRTIARRRVLRLSAGALAVTLLLTAAAFWLHEPLFALLVSAEYRHVSGYLPGLVLSSGLLSSGQMASLFMMSKLKPQKLIVPKIATAVLGAGLNFLGAYWLGLPGVVFAGILFSLIYFIWMTILNWSESSGINET